MRPHLAQRHTTSRNLLSTFSSCIFCFSINRIEINFRTKLIYHASNRYKQDPFWYQSSKYVNKAFLENDVMEKAIKDASKEDVILPIFALSKVHLIVSTFILHYKRN